MGLAGFIFLSAGAPLFISQSLVPVFANGIHTWALSVPPIVVVSLMLCTAVISGFHKRHYWLICYWFTTSALLLALYVVGVLLGLVMFFRLVPLRHPDYHFINVVNLIMWTLLAPFAWCLLRLVRLRYWQPWTRPESWEPGDETAPRWAPSVLSPEVQAEMDAKYGAPRK